MRNEQEYNQYERVVKQNRDLQRNLKEAQDLIKQYQNWKIPIGLSDKNGTLITTGDILKETYSDAEGEHTDYTIVEWHPDSASFVMTYGDFCEYTHFDEFDVDLNNFEIIGDAYSDRNLLKLLEKRCGEQ